MDFVDPYFDESLGILKNLTGATSLNEFKEREAQIVFANELEFEATGVPRTNNSIEVSAIHGQLFQGVFEWAGESRKVDIKKPGDGSEFFLPHGRINAAMEYVFNELSERSYLKDLSRQEFVAQIAYFYDQLNYIHPFREGNGRTQRVFWSRVARDAGYELDWDQVIGDENDEASRLAAEEMDRSALEAMFDRIVKPVDE